VLVKVLVRVLVKVLVVVRVVVVVSVVTGGEGGLSEGPLRVSDGHVVMTPSPFPQVPEEQGAVRRAGQHQSTAPWAEAAAAHLARGGEESDTYVAS